MKYSTASLQNLCLIKIIQDLEYYPLELLACLPPTLRRPLLRHMPIVDLCQLENTCVFEGVDTGTVWNDHFKFADHISKFIESNQNLYNWLKEEDACDSTVEEGFQLEHLKTLIQPTIETSQAAARARKTGYLVAITCAMFECARPTGCYLKSNGYQSELTVGAIDVKKYGVCCQPFDIVNNLVAALRFVDVDQFCESDVDNSDSEEDEIMPVNEWLLRHSPLLVEKSKDTACSTYVDAYKKVNELFQFVPPRYSKYLNKDNHYRLSEEDAVTLLMEKCNYYPEEVHINISRFADIQWSSEASSDLGKIKSLVAKFLSRTIKLVLKFPDPFSDLGVAYKEGILEMLFSSPTSQLSYVHLSDLNDSHFVTIAMLFAEPSSSHRLNSFSADFGDITHTEDEELIGAVKSILLTQSNLSSFKVSNFYIRKSTWNADLTHLFMLGIESFIRQENFEELYIQGDIPEELLAKIVIAFLMSPCTHAQSVTLDLSVGQNVKNDNYYFYTNKALNVPESSLENKSLEITQTASKRDYVFINSWLLSTVQPLRLRKLCVMSGPSTNDQLVLAASNPTLNIQDLHLGVTKFSTEAIQTLLQSKVLRELEIVLGAITDLNDVTAVLQTEKEIGTLEVLKILYSSTGCIRVTAVSDVQQFGNILFSLPQLSQFSLEIDVSFKASLDPANMLEALYNTWKKSKGHKQMKQFVINFRYISLEMKWSELVEYRMLNKELIQTISNEMGMEVKFDLVFA